MRAPLLCCVSMLVIACDADRPHTHTPATEQPLACRGRLDARELMPADAVLVAHYDMDRERRSAPRVNSKGAVGPRALMPAEIEALRLGWVSIAAACELRPDFWGEAWLAVDRDEESVVAIEGEGIGDPDNLRCIRERLVQLGDGEAEQTSFVSDGCGVRFSYDYVDGFAPHDDLLVLGTATALETARATWNQGHGHPPAHLMPAKRSRTWMWAALDVAAVLSPDELRSSLAGSPEDLGALAAVRTVQLEATLARRFSLIAGGGFATEADARAVEAVARALIDAPPPWLPDWAKTIVRGLELDREDAGVELTLGLKKSTAHELGLVPTKTESEQVPAFAWAMGLVFL